MRQGGRMPPLQVARTIWTAMLAAVVMYVVVLAIQPPRGARPSDVAALRPIFALLSIATVGTIFFFRRQLPSSAALTRSASSASPLTTYVICWALSESVALYGLMTGLLA